jgi:3-oxoadipate enol-lactonase
VDRAHLLGLSMGGFIAQELVLTWPERVRSLVLAATHVGLPNAAEVNPDAVAALLASVMLPPAERARVVEPFTYWHGTSRREVERDNLVRAVMPTSDEGCAAQLMACRDWTRAAALCQVSAPTLVLHGRDDQLVPVANGRQLEAAIPGARLEVLAECSHQVFTDQEQRAAEAVLSFIHEVEHAVAPQTGSRP